MRPGRMRNGVCWSVDQLGAWTIVGRAGGLILEALGASRCRRWHGRFSCAAINSRITMVIRVAHTIKQTITDLMSYSQFHSSN